MTYSTILLDLDHTLLDSHASEAAAFAHTMAIAGVDDVDAVFPTYDAINNELWRAVERGETTPTELRLTRFERFVAATGVDADPSRLADAFVYGLGAFGDLYPEARSALEQLAAGATLAMVTNGLRSIQTDRIERLDLGRFFDAVIISEATGVSKPDPRIFDITFAELGEPDRATAVMVGDSLSSDIAGGRNAGIATCWYNPNRSVDARSGDVTHEVASLSQLPALLVS